MMLACYNFVFLCYCVMLYSAFIWLYSMAKIYIQSDIGCQIFKFDIWYPLNSQN